MVNGVIRAMISYSLLISHISSALWQARLNFSYFARETKSIDIWSKGEVTPFFIGIGTLVWNWSEVPVPVPVVPVVPAPALESAPLEWAPSLESAPSVNSVLEQPEMRKMWPKYWGGSNVASYLTWQSVYYTILIWVSHNIVSIVAPIPVMVPAPVIPEWFQSKCAGAGIGGGRGQENRYRRRFRCRSHLTLNLKTVPDISRS